MAAKFCEKCGLNMELHRQIEGPAFEHWWECPSNEPIVLPHSANTRQVGGEHYKVGGEEHWDRVTRLGLDYFQGQITKYVERWKKKNGVQDLEKAQHFLEKYIEEARKGNFK